MSVASILPRRSEFDPQPMWLRFFVNELAVGQFSFFQIFRFPFTRCPSITSVFTIRSSFSFYSFWKDNQAKPVNLIIIIIIIIIITGQKSTFSFSQASDCLTQNSIASILATLSLMKRVRFISNVF
jgi:hypothetical protein